MREEKRLSALKENEKAVVNTLYTVGSIRKRFMDIGLIEGTAVTCEIIGKGISAYNIRGAVVAIRNEDADSIMVSAQ